MCMVPMTNTMATKSCGHDISKLVCVTGSALTSSAGVDERGPRRRPRPIMRKSGAFSAAAGAGWCAGAGSSWRRWWCGASLAAR